MMMYNINAYSHATSIILFYYLDKNHKHKTRLIHTRQKSDKKARKKHKIQIPKFSHTRQESDTQDKN